MKYTIVGASVAGINAAAAIRETDSSGEILLISREEAGHYSRPLLSYYLSGKINEEELLYRGRDYLEQLGAVLVRGKEVAELDLSGKKLLCADGAVFPCDRLLIACGGQARQPDIPGIDLAGVFHFRTLDDARAIRKWSERARVCVMLGGGLVSIKAAEALRARGLEAVHLVIGSDRVMSQAMDRDGAAILCERLARNGVFARTGESVEAIHGDGCVSSVTLRGGTRLECQMVLVGKGVRPELSLARGAGIATDFGILVDEGMRTSQAGVYAAGDVAQALDILHEEARVNALWPLAAHQGWVAGCNMAGRKERYPGWFAMNSLQVFGLPVITMGLVTAEPDGELEVLAGADEKRERYRKLVLRKNRLVGCAVVGDSDASCLAGLIRSGADVSGIKQELLQRGLDDYRLVAHGARQV